MYLVSLGESPSRARRFRGHAMPVFGVGFSNEVGPVLSHSQDGTARVWDVYSRRELRRFDLGDIPLAAAISPDGHLVVASVAGGSIDRWDVETGKQLGRLAGIRRHEAAHSLAFDAGGSRVLAGLHGGDVYVGDLTRDVQISRLTGHTKAVMAVSFSRDGRFAISGGADQSVRVWRLP